MLSTKWCYYAEPNPNSYNILHVNRPISKSQAIYILKKRLQIPKIYLIFMYVEQEE